jgi:hypothetical protein
LHDRQAENVSCIGQFREKEAQQSPMRTKFDRQWPSYVNEAELELLRDIQTDDPRVLGSVSSGSLIATNLTSQSQGVPAIMLIRNLDETTGNDTNWSQ